MGKGRGMFRSANLTGVGTGMVVAGTIGILLLFDWALPMAGRLGSASPACLFDACVPIALHRAMAMSSLFAAIAGIGLILAGRRLRQADPVFTDGGEGTKP